MARSASVMMGRLAVMLVALAALPVMWTWRTVPAQTPAAAGVEAIQPDEILVDLRDNVSAVDVRALDARYNLDLELNDVFAQDEKLMHAHVDPAQRDAVLAALRK